MQFWLTMIVVGVAAGFLLDRWRRDARRLLSPARDCAGACGCTRPGNTAAAPSKASKATVEPIQWG